MFLQARFELLSASQLNVSKSDLTLNYKILPYAEVQLSPYMGKCVIWSFPRFLVQDNVIFCAADERLEMKTDLFH